MDADDTLLKRATAELLNPDLAVTLFRDSPDAIIVVNGQGKMELVNKQAELLTGYHHSELISQTVDMLVPDEARSRHTSHRESYSKEPRLRTMGVGMDLKLRKKDGNTVPVEINLSPVQTVSGLLTIATIRLKKS